MGNNKLFEITNLKPGDTLKTTKSGTTYGIVNKADESSKLAQLKEVNVPIDPTTMMMAVVLYKLEGELKEISELNKKIYSFLVQDKESEIEADLEILNSVIREYKYNYTDKQYLANNHKYVMDIKRTAKKNLNFYKKQITDDILQNKLIVINKNINSVLEELEKKFKYYRLSLYTYSFSSFLEIFLLGNYQVDYLITKKEELEALDNEYTNNYEMASKFIQNIANKSLEGNFLKGIGSASKTMGNLASKVSIMKEKDFDKWLTDKGESLSKTSNDMKDTFIIKFENVKESKSKVFIDKIEDINIIYNKTKSIYFDNNYIYLSNDNDK